MWCFIAGSLDQCIFRMYIHSGFALFQNSVIKDCCATKDCRGPFFSNLLISLFYNYTSQQIITVILLLCSIIKVSYHIIVKHISLYYCNFHINYQNSSMFFTHTSYIQYYLSELFFSAHHFYCLPANRQAYTSLSKEKMCHNQLKVLNECTTYV